jgi:hypothetical protein
MREIIHTLTSTYTRRRFTHNIFFKLGCGCLGLVFTALCLGSLLFVYLLPQ